MDPSFLHCRISCSIHHFGNDHNPSLWIGHIYIQCNCRHQDNWIVWRGYVDLFSIGSTACSNDFEIVIVEFAMIGRKTIAYLKSLYLCILKFLFFFFKREVIQHIIFPNIGGKDNNQIGSFFSDVLECMRNHWGYIHNIGRLNGKQCVT